MDPHFYAGMSTSVETIWPLLYESPSAVIPNTRLIRMIQIQNLARQNEWSPEALKQTLITSPRFNVFLLNSDG